MADRARHRREGRRCGPALLVLLLVVALGAAGGLVWRALSERDAGLGRATSSPSVATSAPTTTTPTSTRAPTAAEAAYERLTPAQRVGQLFVFAVQSGGATSDELAGLRRYSAGNVFLRGHNDLGVDAMTAVTAEAARATTFAGVRPFVSADQEGGGAQGLEGPGFDDMPSGVRQGQRDPVALQKDSQVWGRQLAEAGVNLDLAPVADVVPADIGRANAPIGSFSREYGTTPGVVGPAVAAFVRGMTEAGVATSVKHFPGIGRATGNTDSAQDVTDPTTPDDPFLQAFKAGIDAGAPMVMMSSANYPAIDPTERACFSSVIMRDLLRERLGFEGVVISDSFGSTGMADVPPADRALRYFRAGGTLLLNTKFRDLEPMTTAVLNEAAGDPEFAELTRQNVLLVLQAKDELGLLGPA